jgi:1-phosphofructokinase family hexose kinase
MSGSLPKGVEPSFYGRVLSVIPENVKVIVDTEKANMLSALQSREIFMVKPNLRELEDFTGRVVRDLHDMVKASAKYLNMGVKYVLVSLGAEGAVLTDGTESFFCKSASVAVNSTVGAGDSMVSAVCVGVEKGVPMQEILRMAAAAGTAAVTTSGTNLFYRDKYNEIYSKIYSEKIY